MNLVEPWSTITLKFNSRQWAKAIVDQGTKSPLDDVKKASNQNRTINDPC
jgi:hypothetical protein